MTLGCRTKLAQRSLMRLTQVCSAGEYRKESSKIVQSTLVSYVLSIIEKDIATQLQGSRKPVSSLQVLSSLDEEATHTLDDRKFVSRLIMVMYQYCEYYDYE